MGRRVFKKVISGNSTVISHQRFIYRGYLQIACVDLTRTNHPALWLITWDPTQPIATRPLAIQKDGTWYTYGLDLTKNVCEVFGATGYIRTAYTYSPFGSVTATGNVTQPIQWSSEFYDEELGLVYYNWRYYNAMDGRWLTYDIIVQNNPYLFVNNAIYIFDALGLANLSWEKTVKSYDEDLIYDDELGRIDLKLKIDHSYPEASHIKVTYISGPMNFIHNDYYIIDDNPNNDKKSLYFQEKLLHI